MVQFPYHAVYSVTNRCPLECVHCSAAAGSARTDELTTAEALDVLSQLRAAGVFDLAVSGGEPLLRPDIWDLLHHAVALGFRVGIGSSGLPLTQDNVARLADSGVHRVQISLDGLAATHDRVRGHQGLFQRARAAVEQCVAAGIRTHVCFTPHRLNHHELESVVQQAVAWGVSLINVSQFVATGRGTQALNLSPGEQEDLFRRWRLLRDQYRSQVVFTSHLARRSLVDDEVNCMPGFRGCQAGQALCAIDPCGNVFPCVMLPTALGNLRQQPFRAIWGESPLVHALQDRTRVGGYCGGCPHLERCGGCRAAAYAHTGDPLAADPDCWLFAPPPARAGGDR